MQYQYSYGRRDAGRRGEGISRREKRALLRLAAAALILLLTVAAKIAVPGTMENLRIRFGEVFGADMNVREVFSAFGHAVSGDGSASENWREVYRAVFAPSERNEEGENPPAEGTDIGTIDAAVSETDLPCYSAENTPQRVSMTQQVLGFSYAAPLEGAVTSAFGFRRAPIGGEDEFHYGIDLAADEGATVHAFADGTVRLVGESSSYGKYLIIDHTPEIATLYAHCSRIVAAVGEEVCCGEIVAEAGQTGNATGPHLHFELHRGSDYLNPVYYVESV